MCAMSRNQGWQYANRGFGLESCRISWCKVEPTDGGYCFLEGINTHGRIKIAGSQANGLN